MLRDIHSLPIPQDLNDLNQRNQKKNGKANKMIG